MERIWADYESVEPYLAPDAAEEIIMDVKVDYTSPTSSSKPFQVSY
jgi:phosphoinositide-3-kinase, regulatory subunit 4